MSMEVGLEERLKSSFVSSSLENSAVSKEFEVAFSSALSVVEDEDDVANLPKKTLSEGLDGGLDLKSPPPDYKPEISQMVLGDPASGADSSSEEKKTSSGFSGDVSDLGGESALNKEDSSKGTLYPRPSVVRVVGALSSEGAIRFRINGERAVFEAQLAIGKAMSDKGVYVDPFTLLTLDFSDETSVVTYAKMSSIMQIMQIRKTIFTSLGSILENNEKTALSKLASSVG